MAKYHLGAWIPLKNHCIIFIPVIDFSVGSFGCNFRCKFCQNWQIAQQTEVFTKEISPNDLVQAAKKQDDNLGIAYTYNEPTIWYEYVIECASSQNRKVLRMCLLLMVLSKRTIK